MVAAGMIGCQPHPSTHNAVSGSVASGAAKYSDAPYKMAKVVCDPFEETGGGSTSSYGIRGKLYYIPPGQTTYSNVDQYILKGVNTGMFVFLNSIDVPTHMFYQGFTAMDGHTVSDPSGNMLVEWFAMDFETRIKLGPNDAAGDYQLAILSDDGAILDYKDYTADNPDTQPYQTLINNDGLTPTRMACATKTLSLKELDRVPVELKYFQGPRWHIALTLMWRKVDATTNLNDPLCGVSGNYTYFNPDYTPSRPQKAYNDLLARGWKVLTPDNFTLPASTRPAPCTQQTF